MKINHIEAMDIAYAIQDYVKHNHDIPNCNPDKLLKISDYLLKWEHLEKGFNLKIKNLSGGK